MIVIPLGTASAMPTKKRHLPALAVTAGAATVLFDCGEGTQLRMMQAGVNHTRVKAIFITHLHGDHYFGLLGLLSTMMLASRQCPLTIVAPNQLEDFLDGLPTVFDMTFTIRHVGLPENFSSGLVFETDGFTVEACALDHRVFAVGYRLEEKRRPGNLDVEAARALGVTEFVHFRALKRGHRVVLHSGNMVTPDAVLTKSPLPRSMAYVTDTRPCAGSKHLARQASLVYHEATFGDAFEERAQETGHSTARQAAAVARSSGAKRLLLGHFSARYADAQPLVNEAREVFPQTEAAVELQRYEI